MLDNQLEGSSKALAAMAFWVLAEVAAVLLALAVVEYLFERIFYAESLKMTRREVLEEMKQESGDPVVKDMLAGLEVSDSLKNLKARVEKLVPVYEEALATVKALENQDAQDFLARRLYDMTAELVMSLLILRDATKAPELFEKSANVYVRMTEEDVFGKSAYIKAFQVEDLASFKANDENAE